MSYDTRIIPDEDLINIDAPIGALKTQLSKLLLSVDRIGWLTGSTTGRFDVRRTSRMMAGSERVFKARTETPATTTAVSIIIDLSYSMANCDSGVRRIDVASQCAYAIATAVERSNCDIEVIGFGGEDTPIGAMSPKAMAGMDGVSGSGSGGERYKQAELFDIKPFNAKAATCRRSFQLLRHMTNFYTPDYHSVRTVTEGLVQRTEQRKIVIVLTDGLGDSDKMLEFTKFSSRVYKVPVLGIGILTSPYQMRCAYDKFVTVDSLKELSEVAIRSLISQIESTTH